MFSSGASVLWGIELEEDQNHLFPVEQPRRQPRSTSHLFATTIIPTGVDTFDVEYILQIEIGGFPGWLTGPIVVETVKKMFRFANGYFKGGLDGTGDLAKRLASVEDLEPLNPMGSLEDHEESVKNEVDIDDADAPPPVKKRRRDVIRSRLGLGKRNKLETSRSK